jgi:antirestriction protein ArdC
MRAEVKARDVPVLPEWSQLLIDAVKEHGIISSAYHRFWNYSVGNQLLVLFQCMSRKLEPGPINTYLRWKELGRSVVKGEKALTLCMPVTCTAKQSPEDLKESEADKPDTYTRFVYRPNWFLLSQTTGEPYKPQELPEWSESRALRTLKIERIPFDYLNGNAQGFARQHSIAVSPIAFAPHRTLFHELAHVVLGHTGETEELSDGEEISGNLREVEAECVALICCESLRLAGAEFCRGYIQHWLQGETILERSAQRIFKAADQILRAGREGGADGSGD